MVFARSSNRSDAAPRAKPGGSASAFCAPVKTKSSFQASLTRGDPASDVTASTKSITSSNWWATRESSSSGASAPVEVSEWTRLTASTSERLMASCSRSGSMVFPNGTSSRTTSRPQAAAMAANRSPNAPLTSESTRFRTPDRTAISMNPVAEQVPMMTSRRVRNSRFRGSAAALPVREELVGAFGVDRLHGVGYREEPGRRMPLEQAFDGVPVAHVQGHPVQDDALGIQLGERGLDVRVGEYVEPVFVEQQVA